MASMAFLLAVIFITGCAESRYAQEGRGVQDTEQDTFVCENKVLSEHKGAGNLSSKEIQGLVDDCMKAKGYRVKH